MKKCLVVTNVHSQGWKVFKVRLRVRLRVGVRVQNKGNMTVETSRLSLRIYFMGKTHNGLSP